MYKTVKDRRAALEKELKVDLTHIGTFMLDERVASTRNCENMIGAVQIPMGVAGPLRVSRVKGHVSKEYWMPLATTEGALVASINRGCKAIGASGGATVDSYHVGATRGPVFRVNSLAESDRLNTFLEDHFDELAQVAAETSRHLRLKKYMDRGVGRYLYVRFVFDTQEAMGLNMVTIATQAIVEFIAAKTGIRCLAVAGNFDVDKKPSWLNIVEGRGYKVWAEVTIPARVLADTLKATAGSIYETWLAKCMVGSAMAGSMAFNAQYANVVAAIFLATGQDPAHIGEGSLGITTAEVVNGKDLYMSVHLPDLMVGTVGGGMGLATQKEALSILGFGGSPAGGEGKHAKDFAEVIGGAVLAGELSLLASLSEGTLARAHETLGRGKK